MMPVLLQAWWKIKRDYVELPKIIKKMESSKYTIREAHADITDKFYIQHFYEDSCCYLVTPFFSTQL